MKMPARPSRNAYQELLDEVRDAAERRGIPFRYAMMNACIWFLREVGEDVSVYGDGVPRIDPPTAGKNSRRTKPVRAPSGTDGACELLVQMQAGQTRELWVNGRSLCAAARRLHANNVGTWQIDRAGMCRWMATRIR